MDMSDDEFLEYVWFHSRTPMALFFVDDANRLLSLAGRQYRVTQHEFVSIKQNEADVLIRHAKEAIVDGKRDRHCAIHNQPKEIADR